MTRVIHDFNTGEVLRNKAFTESSSSRALKAVTAARLAFVAEDPGLVKERAKLRSMVLSLLKDIEKLERDNGKSSGSGLPSYLTLDSRQPEGLNRGFAMLTLESMQIEWILMRLASFDGNKGNAGFIEKLRNKIGAAERLRVDLTMKHHIRERKFNDAENQYITDLSAINSQSLANSHTLLPIIQPGPKSSTILDIADQRHPSRVAFYGRGVALGLLAALMIALTLQNFSIKPSNAEVRPE